MVHLPHRDPAGDLWRTRGALETSSGADTARLLALPGSDGGVRGTNRRPEDLPEEDRDPRVSPKELPNLPLQALAHRFPPGGSSGPCRFSSGLAIPSRIAVSAWMFRSR